MPLYIVVKAMTFAAVVLFSTSAGATIVTDWNNAGTCRGAGEQTGAAYGRACAGYRAYVHV